MQKVIDVEEHISEAGLKRPALIPLKDLHGLERVRAAARIRGAHRREAIAEGNGRPIEPEYAVCELQKVIEQAAWSAWAVGITDTAAVVRAAREAMADEGVDLSLVDMEDDEAERLALFAMQDRLDEDPPAYIPPLHLEAESFAREAAAEWTTECPDAMAVAAAHAVVSASAELARSWPAIDFRDAALIVALAFKDAGAVVSEGVLVDAENAAYDVGRLSPGEKSILAAVEASLLKEVARGSDEWSEDDFDDNYAAHRERLESGLIARLEGCERARDAAEKVAPSLVSWIFYNSEAHFARVRLEMRAHEHRLAIQRHRARRKAAKESAPITLLKMAIAEAGALREQRPNIKADAMQSRMIAS